MLFSRVKISCFRAKAHLVFHWCLYNKHIYVAAFVGLETAHYTFTSNQHKSSQLGNIVNFIF